MTRHPSAEALAAWFDGETAAGVGDHIADCERCRRRVHELRRVRAAVRGEPVPAPLPPGVPWWRPFFAPAAVAAVIVALLAATVPSAMNGPLDAARALLGRDDTPGRITTPVTTSSVPPATASSVAPRQLPPPAPPTSIRTATTHPARPLPVLRLAVVVPTAGPLAAEGAATVRAVQQVVAATNRAGGVAGRAVELTVVDAGDARAVARLEGSATVATGGFGAVPPAPWLFPADPYLSGSLAIEATPAETGTILARDLQRRGVPGRAAAIVAPGPDAGLADGVERALPIVRVGATAETSCDAEIGTARRSLPAVLALAVPPELALRCLEAAARVGWRPPAGVLLAPSAAYAGLAANPSSFGTRTVLGLPWPTGDEPGAARFRAAVPGVASYRALVAYTAAELTVAVARAHSPFRLGDLATGTWRTDLISLNRGTNLTARIVVSGQTGWSTVAFATNERE